MGLTISIGLLDDLRQNDAEGYAHCKKKFADLATFLAMHGHPGFAEPERLEPVTMPPHTSSFPYAFLHYLRRAFAHVRTGTRTVLPCRPSEDPSRDPLVDRELTVLMNSHLICHSDAEGYYVPNDFTDVLYATKKQPITGGMVGSSPQLLRELAQVAPGIGITYTGDAPLEEVLHALAREDELSGPLWRERMVWLTLFVVARASVKYGSVIVFH
jgi:hypothetical protein